jgi:lysozyme
MIELEKQLKEHEGFRGMPYDDSLGYPTIGYGTKLPINEDEAELIMKYRLEQKRDELIIAMPFVYNLPDDKQKVLYEMSYQMGVRGVLLFKRMWSALKSGDFEKAADEMLDSKWAVQTPSRAKKLSEIMRGKK